MRRGSEKVRRGSEILLGRRSLRRGSSTMSNLGLGEGDDDPDAGAEAAQLAREAAERAEAVSQALAAKIFERVLVERRALAGATAEPPDVSVLFVALVDKPAGAASRGAYLRSAAKNVRNTARGTAADKGEDPSRPLLSLSLFSSHTHPSFRRPGHGSAQNLRSA